MNRHPSVRYNCYNGIMGLDAGGEIKLKKKWLDENRECKCESCGRIIPEERLKWDNDLGYCEDCYREIKEYDNSESQQSS